MAETQQDIVNQIGREDEEERLNAMTKTHMSEKEIDGLMLSVKSHGTMGGRGGGKTIFISLCKQAKLASSAIAEAKALRALIEGLEVDPDPGAGFDMGYSSANSHIKSEAKKIPLLQQGEDNG